MSADGMSRRTFSQVVGAAAIGGALPDLALGGVSPVPSTAEDLCYLSAVELAVRIRRKQLSAREVLSAHLARVERVNPKVNAIVTLVAERAMDDARRADEAQAHGDK